MMMPLVMLILGVWANPPAYHAPPPVQTQARSPAQALATSVYDSSRAPMVDTTQLDLCRCYIGMPVPLSGRGWFEATIVNDTDAPVSFAINGRQVSIWKPNMVLTSSRTVAERPLPDVIMSTDSGAAREQFVLNPHEACDMVLPYIQIHGSMAMWRVYLTQYLASNPFGGYEFTGVEGNLHSTAHSSIAEIDDEWYIAVRGDRRLSGKGFLLSSQFGK